jgi:hypothetical protein
MTPSTQILARIKLRETERQRDRLNQQYNAIEQRAAVAATPLERLRALHEGLRGIAFARKPLHPEVANLDVLYLADELGSAPPGLVAERTALLDRELAQGRLRAEFTYAFGRILSEWTSPAADTALPAAEDAADSIALLWQEPPAVDRAWFDQAFAALEPALRTVREAVDRFGRGDVFAPVRHEEVTTALQRMTRDSNALPSFRQQAGAVLTAQRQVHEYAGVLTILLNNLDEWDWPEEGLPLRRFWARVKYRPYLDEDLITALFLQVIGARWGSALKPLLIWSNLKVGDRPLFPDEPLSSPTARIAPLRRNKQACCFMSTVPLATSADEGPGGYSADTMLDILATVEAESRLAAALDAEQPLFVVQADLVDFYPSVGHELLLLVLEHLGVPQRWLNFFGKFLSARVRSEDGPRRLRRGLPLEHLLADVLTECLLFVLDLRVYQQTHVQTLRVVDDFWFLARSRDQALAAWGEVEAFCRAAGLAINAEKAGSVCLGQKPQPTDGLPAGQPRWGLLRLHADGVWEVDEPAFARLEATIRAHLAVAPSVLELVSCYSGYLHYILGKLGLSLSLGGNHLRRMAERLTRLHEGLFGPGHGPVEEVRRRLQGSFADARLKERGVPEALVYWPITAGGLALLHPLLHIATYLHGRPRQRGPKPPTHADVINHFLGAANLAQLQNEEVATLPTGPARRGPRRAEVARFLESRPGDQVEPPLQARIDEVTAELWEKFYVEAVPQIEPSGPIPMPAMERLVADFINRGSEVSGRTQSGLTPYWRWVVYSYGPALLAALGTYRFLITELVPLQLILENRRSASWELEADTTGSSEDEVPF